MTHPHTDDHEPVWRTAQEVALIFEVKPRTVRMWAWRGHITNHGDRFDLREVLHWWENTRHIRMDAVRRGLSGICDGSV